MKMKNFTSIPNKILLNTELSLSARFLYCVIAQHCYQKTGCYPSQDRLAKCMGFTSSRHIRNLLKELLSRDLIRKYRGVTRSCVYIVMKPIVEDRNGDSYITGTAVPLYPGNLLLPNNKEINKKECNKKSVDGFQELRKSLINKGILKK